MEQLAFVLPELKLKISVKERLQLYNLFWREVAFTDKPDPRPLEFTAVKIVIIAQ